MKGKLNVALAAGFAVVMATGCVSSKKYHASQNALAAMRNDSVALAQQNASLNQNIQSLQDKNSQLQKNLDATNTNLANQQKSLGYYQDYFGQQQTAMNQVSTELKSALSQAGVADGDITQVNNTIYVSLDEGSVFKKNTTECTKNGKDALSGIAQVIKSHDNVNIFVNDGDSAMATGTAASSSSGMSNSGMSDNSTATTTVKKHHWHKKAVASNSTGADATATATASTSAPRPMHKKIHHKYSSESGSMTYTTNSGRPMSKNWSLKQRRMGTVANSFLKNGVNKVHVTLRQPDLNGGQPGNVIKVVITPKMTDFNPQAPNSTSSR